jgi:hypothetical protein
MKNRTNPRAAGPTPGRRRRWSSVIAAVVLAGIGMAAAPPSQDGLVTMVRTQPHVQKGSREFAITTVSARNDLIAGGQVLVRIAAAPAIALGRAVVTLNGSDITSSFQPEAPGGNSLLGLVTGLQLGDNRLAVEQTAGGGEEASLELTNFPITGPVTSGPQITPYQCETVESGMGEPLDANCSVPTLVDFFYKTTSRTFAPLPSLTGPLPANVAFTTTNDGVTVPYVVRVESGTINRTIYRIAMLALPSAAPFVPGPGWNRKLIVSFSGGCDAEYTQGSNQATDVLSDNELSRGFAFALSSELVNNLHCNAALQGEALMMLKQHFIETYGPPKWTSGEGASGGAIQQYLVAEMFPGLLDGLQPDISFPDSQLVSVQECRLLVNVYKNDPGTWTEAKQDAVNGYAPTTCESWDSSFANTNVSTTGVTPPPCGLTDQSLVFNPVTNPGGARCDIQDMQVNVVGRMPTTGYARIAGDNTGVQYGLAALNSGAISADEFIALNQQVGGFDVNGNIVAQRSVGDPLALQRIYLSGLDNGGGGGLGTVAILTQRTYFDLIGDILNIHDRLEDFIIRARLQRANGTSDNQIIWTAGPAGAALGGGDTTLAQLSLDMMNAWLDNIAADPQPLTTAKIAADKPAGAVDACFDASGNEIVEPASVDGAGQCNTLYPVHSQPRILAGMPLTNDIVKCQLKPIDLGDYQVTFTAAQLAALQAAFPTGVCDYTRPGVGQLPLYGTYLRFSMGGDGDDVPN